MSRAWFLHQNVGESDRSIDGCHREGLRLLRGIEDLGGIEAEIVKVIWDRGQKDFCENQGRKICGSGRSRIHTVMQSM